MKVYIGPYKNWFGPHQLAELLCFWREDRNDDRTFKFGEWLAYGKTANVELESDKHETILYKFLLWFDKKKKRKIDIRIDKYDTWSMDNTLAYIVLPMLKQLRDTQHGYAMVDDIDVPENLRLYDRENDYSGQLELFDFPIANEEGINIKLDQWNWVLNEMIFAFEHLVDDSWEDQFRSGEPEFILEKDVDENGNSFNKMTLSDDSYKCDYQGIMKVNERMENGFRLFGKYFRALWD